MGKVAGSPSITDIQYGHCLDDEVSVASACDATEKYRIEREREEREERKEMEDEQEKKCKRNR